MTRFEDLLASAITWVLAAVGTGTLWLIRRVLTNEKQIAMLQTEIAHRDGLRREDRDRLKEVSDDMKALRNEIHNWIRKSQ